MSRAILLAVGLLAFGSSAGADEARFGDFHSGAQLRSLYFRRDLPSRIQETWAAGGWAWTRSGYWRDFLSIGATFAGAFPLVAPEDRDSAGLLKPGQDGYAVLAEAYARIRVSEQFLTLYRQSISAATPQRAEGVRLLALDTNYLGPRDLRMTPITYEAAMLNGKYGDSLRYQAGYVAKAKDMNSDRFVSMSRLAGVTTKDEGMWTGGVQWSPRKDLWLQAFYYAVPDTLRIGYADLDWVTRTSKETYYRFAAQYTMQRSDGANLLTGRAFKTRNGAVYGEYGWHWLKVYGALATTGEGQRIRTPYSFGPFFITQRIKTFNRANEDALLLGTTFDLGAAGLPGFSIDVNTANGRHAIDPGSGAALPKWCEYDTDFVYRFAKDSALSGMRLRFRWATVREQFATRTDRTDDLRFDVNWAIEFH